MTPEQRAHKLEYQRNRRRAKRRIDYYAAPAVVAVINSQRTRDYGGDASSILNRIVLAWIASTKKP